MKIDVVVPIYNAYEALLICLRSLEKYHALAKNVILINDASTDVRIAPLIADYSQRNGWISIHQKHNKGFVYTANKGLTYSNHNTLLLNSDTVVSQYWLHAFNMALINNERIGTITAWSNNAEICSIPKYLFNNNAPKNIDYLSEVLYKKYQPSYPQLPTAVGFCMLITQLAKNTIGYFDEKHFGHGYGEENDYSLRVTQAGLKNILCDNAYVVHIGNESFADLGLKPSADTMQRLLNKHPHYMQLIQPFIDNDPLFDVRSKVMSLLRSNNAGL